MKNAPAQIHERYVGLKLLPQHVRIAQKISLALKFLYKSEALPMLACLIATGNGC